MTAQDTSLDLGIIDGPMLIFGGPYSNFRATRALYAEAQNLGIPPARVLCTGDVVAYAAEPAETTDLIMDWGIATVMGNCEESLGWEADDCGCGFEEGTDCDVMSRQWYAYAHGRLTDAHRTWMRGLPRTVRFTLGGRRFAAVHGSAASINEFVFEQSDDAVKALGFAALDADAVIGGHSGVPFTQVLPAGLWHNAGVIGMPANDATPRVWYSTLHAAADGIRITHHALSYDHNGAASAMRDERLPEGYAGCLESGLWPNMDVMPAPEREKAGRPLVGATVDWPASSRNAAE